MVQSLNFYIYIYIYIYIKIPPKSYMSEFIIYLNPKVAKEWLLNLGDEGFQQ